MKSHGVKLIVMGRILEALYSCANVKCAKRTMTVDELYGRLKTEKFTPRIAAYIRTQGGITRHHIQWLLTLMSKRARAPFGFIEIPLVKLVSYKRGRPGEWAINRTTVKHGLRPLKMGD